MEPFQISLIYALMVLNEYQILTKLEHFYFDVYNKFLSW